MTRATVFRIVGFAFLLFAALSIYRGEFGVGRTGVVIVTRAHDPDAFWRGIVIQIGIGCALLYLSRSARTPQASMGLAVDASQQPLNLPNYDPEFCGKIVKGAASVCFGLVVAELLVLLFVHPSDDRCPGWIFHPNQRSAVSLWLLAGMFTALPTAWICNVALRWDDYYARKVYDSIANGPPGQLLMDANWLLLMVLAGWCLFCGIPLFLMSVQCTALSDYLSSLHF